MESSTTQNLVPVLPPGEIADHIKQRGGFNRVVAVFTDEKATMARAGLDPFNFHKTSSVLFQANSAEWVGLDESEAEGPGDVGAVLVRLGVDEAVAADLVRRGTSTFSAEERSMDLARHPRVSRHS